MLTIHHLGISQSDRVVWLCEELEVPYDFIRYARDATTRLAPAEYKALHPSGTAPVISDGGMTLAETGAIFEYILTKYGQGRLAAASDQPNYADYLFWLHYPNGSLMPTEMINMMLKMAQVADDAPVWHFVNGRTVAAYQQINERLGMVPYLAGADFTAADIMMLFPLSTMGAFFARDLTPYPNIAPYVERLKARPAYQRAMAKAEPK